MKSKIVLSISSVVLMVLIATVAMPKTSDQIGMKVHEWGTFTSVAGENGEAMPWRTFGASADLPCFVDRFGGFKGGLYATVRMETPVLYFYGQQASSVYVNVGFPKGTITEWYPKATVGHSHESIEWSEVRISPEAAETYPVERGQSHYYAARKTDAAPLQVGSQQEKFLFYRGVGTFPLPISAQILDDRRILVKNVGKDAVNGVILFENRGGQIGYRVVGTLEKEVMLDLPSLQADWSGLSLNLENTLVAEGLYRKEAQAMIETWRDSWFEEGARLFYVVPRADIDSILPLNVQPSPSQIARVFVGRMELITPAIQNEVKDAIAKNDRAALEKYGRFLEPIAKRIGAKSALVDSLTASFAPNCR